MVTMTSNAGSESKFDKTGPGSLRCGTLVSPSVLPIVRGDQASFPLDPSNFQSHIAPVDESVVVIRIYPVFESIWT